MAQYLLWKPEMNSAMKAIRAKCVDCSGGNTAEANACTVVRCPLFPYRFGRNPDKVANKYKNAKTVKIKVIPKPEEVTASDIPCEDED